jgi:hypothetical protein
LTWPRGPGRIRRNRGFRVRETTDRDLDEIVELRQMIEVRAIRTIAQRMPAMSGCSGSPDRCTTTALFTGLTAQHGFRKSCLVSFGDQVEAR